MPKRNLLLIAAALIAGFGAAIAVLALFAGGPSEPDVSAAIAAGSGHTCMVTEAGAAECWGATTDGQLGDGSCCEGTLESPVAVRGLDEDVVAVAAGAQHSCALTGAGAVWCWGGNVGGELGDGSTISRQLPDVVQGIEGDVTGISASQGRWHTCAVTSDGGVQCWGNNQFGQIGNGRSDDVAPRPTPVKGLGGKAKAVSAGGMHTCALLDDGRVQCWGDNRLGQLGDGSDEARLRPVDVVDGKGRPLEGVKSVSAGLFHTCAAMKGGGAYCWGQAHDQTMEMLQSVAAGYTLVAVPVPGLEGDLTAIAAGAFHTCALPDDGPVVCWGNDSEGQLGDGDINVGRPEYSERPDAVQGIDGDAIAIDAGDVHTCALMEDRSAYCWGAGVWTATVVPGTTEDPSAEAE
jgi:alpha-tubulin suppressor-like RCC1 family protein